MIKKYNVTVRYIFALAVVGAGALLRLVLTIFVGAGLPTFVTFYPAVMFAALLAGFGPGLLATIASALVAGLWLLHPAGSFIKMFPVDAVALAIFTLMGAFMSWVAESYRKRTSELEKARADVDNERLRLYEVMETLPVYVVLLTKDYHVPFANRFFRERFGESHGKRCYEYLFNRTEPCEICETYTVMKTSAPHHWEWTGPDNRNYDIFDFPFTDADGSMLIMEMGIDITEQKKAHEELKNHRDHLEELVEERTKGLQESEARLNRSQEIAHLGSWELDLTSNRLAWSDEVYRIFGIKPREFGASYDAFLEAVHPDDRTAVDAAYSGSLREGRDTYEIEHRVVRKSDGDTRVVYEKCSHIRDESGTIIRSIGMVHDITERKKAEEELRKVNQNLEQFAYVASHDLQEPLRIMSNFSQLLERRYRGRLDSDADEFIGYIVEAADRMQKLITDLLAYSRAGHKGADITEVDCADVVKRVLKSMAVTIESAGGAVTCDELPVISAHEAGIMQLFQNMIANALKFRSEEPPRIHVSSVRADNQWIFSVRDNGIGIEQQYNQRIFQMFQRLHPRDRYAGTGIGLAICKKIVENHGGKIWVESEPCKGSAFYFTIPGNVA